MTGKKANADAETRRAALGDLREYIRIVTERD